MREYKTIDRVSGKELTPRSPFWKHLRNYGPMSSQLGYKVTDVDSIMVGPTGNFIMVEHKCRSIMPADWQNKILTTIDTALKTNAQYKGCYLIIHTGEDIDDGSIYIHELINGEWNVLKGNDGKAWDFAGEWVFKFINKKIQA
jgi:hypothetical protein